jgi:hypothetical protein
MVDASSTYVMGIKVYSYHIELSDDIRGERLRFVEAMKEATAINVQSNAQRPHQSSYLTVN